MAKCFSGSFFNLNHVLVSFGTYWMSDEVYAYFNLSRIPSVLTLDD